MINRELKEEERKKEKKREKRRERKKICKLIYKEILSPIYFVDCLFCATRGIVDLQVLFYMIIYTKL
jgi:hypothetical protein